jgi:hypothetical protein
LNEVYFVHGRVFLELGEEMEMNENAQMGLTLILRVSYSLTFIRYFRGFVTEVDEPFSTRLEMNGANVVGPRRRHSAGQFNWKRRADSIGGSKILTGS